MQTINASGQTMKNLPSPKKKKRNIGIIVDGTIGGVAAILAAIGVFIFVQRRRRWRRFTRPGPRPQMIVTPFDANSSETTQGSGIFAEWQPSVIGDQEAEVVTPLHLSSSLAPPVWLSDKEMARLRAETLRSQQPPHLEVSTLDVPQSVPSPDQNAINESGEAITSYDPRRLHSEVESLRREMERLREIERLREMERLRAEVLVTAPPSYAEGHG
jgi:hypothetical protein